MDDIALVLVPLRNAEDRRAMVRIQIGMWVDDGAACLHCGKAYASVDDFLDRDPRAGKDGGPPTFVDSACWDEWVSKESPAP